MIRIGYPCINRSLPCSGDKTFRLKSYSEERLIETVTNNLSCLEAMLRYNVEHDLRFFRITSNLVPFASHPVCEFPWQTHFRDQFETIGQLIRKEWIRISMHPDQFTVINAKDPEIISRSVRELVYHEDVMRLLGLDLTAKFQIHVGGVYGDREGSLKRFEQSYRALPADVRARLVIENDDVSYPLADCLRLHRALGVPILFDVFHHQILNQGEPIADALKAAAQTWKKQDGPIMIDYSSQQAGGRRGNHVEHIDIEDFKRFLKVAKGMEMDVMLEIKDKEKSALPARTLLKELLGH